jgi:hypothetical protein
MSLTERVYAGSLDDVVARYPWGKEAGYTLEEYLGAGDSVLKDKILQSFNATLQFNALFGRELLINDGYLLNHPAAKIAILDPAKSPLRAMLEGTRITVLQRDINVGLDEVALHMARNENNTSFQKLIDQPDWPNYQQELREISSIHGLKQRWPSYDISEGLDNLLQSLGDLHFKQVLEKLSNKDIDDLLIIYRRVRSEKDKAAPRDAWEIACKELFTTNTGKLYEAMQVANVLYHANFSMCLASDSASNIAMETVSTRGMEGILDQPNTPLLSASDAEDLKSILDSLSGRLYFPDANDILDGEKLCELYSGKTGSPGAAKLLFLKELEKFKDIEPDKQSLHAAADNYSAALRDLFKPDKPSGKLNMTVDGAKNELSDIGEGAASAGLSSWIKNASLMSAAGDSGASAFAGIIFKFHKPILVAALPYIKAPPIGQDSQFLKNIKSRNRLFDDVYLSSTINNEAAKLHTESIRKFQ